MNNKKEQEREELHKTIWKIANELRGSVDGWDFKQYVLGLLFYRFISENIEHYVNENQRKAGIENFEYRKIPSQYPPADMHYNEVTWGSWGGLNISEMKYCFDITII